VKPAREKSKRPGSTTKLKNVDGASAYHFEQRDSLLAWMREDPKRALRYVALAWFQCAKFEGKADHAPMAEVLGALAAAKLSAIVARNGPRAWARRQCDGRLALPRSKAEAGRQLVMWIKWWLDEHGVDLRGDLRALVRPASGNDELSFPEWIVSVVSSEALSAGWGPPFSRDPDLVDERVVEELKKTIKRMRCTLEHLAIAVLVGWGMSRTLAKDAVKYA